MNESFFRDVYDIVREIPRGRATSYGAISKFLQKKGGARMVGWAMNACPSDVPAHRVVNHKGELSASEIFQGEASMQSLLEKEGIVVAGNKILNWKTVFWDPSQELI